MNRFSKVSAAAAFILASGSATMAGALDGGTAPQPSDVAITGYISPTNDGGNNTVVGSGSSSYDSSVLGGPITINGADYVLPDANNTAIGANSTTAGQGNEAIGFNATASGRGNFAAGMLSSASGLESIAIGEGAAAGGFSGSLPTNGDVAIGAFSIARNYAPGFGASALGYRASATGLNGVAIGSNSLNTTDNAVSFGTGGSGNGPAVIPPINQRTEK